MKKMLFFSIVIFQIFKLISTYDKKLNNTLSIEITKSKSHEDQTGQLIPLVVTISSSDIDEKVKGVDIIFVVDVSGSMAGEKLDLVKESLKYLVSIMDERDRFALVTFSDSSYLINDLTKMTRDNKNEVITNINILRDIGGTNIYSGLEEGLSLLRENYTYSDNVASIILLSDGLDNYLYYQVVNRFNELLIQQNKKEYMLLLYILLGMVKVMMQT